jgi:hypothetical protein
VNRSSDQAMTTMVNLQLLGYVRNIAPPVGLTLNVSKC